MEIKGYTYGYLAKKGVYTSPEAKESRIRLMQTGINWVCLAFSVRQQSFASTQILYDYKENVSDLEIISTIEHFHENGIKVCLKPMIDCADGMWRALISFPDRNMGEVDIYWKAWFESYTAYLVHYAEIAQHCGCEMFCLGCEMLGTERKEDYWRSTIAQVRKVYSGKLTYNTNHGKEEEAKWYDEVDYLGTSAYYPVAEKPGASFEEMKANWDRIAERLGRVSERVGKKILFMEIGCRSAEGCAMMPWDFMHREFPRSEEEQANFFEASLAACADKPWFAGYFWWDWSPVIYTTPEKASVDCGFNIHMKKAEEVIKRYYKN